MKKILSTSLSTLLIFLPILSNAEDAVKVAKSSDKAEENKEMPKPKNIDKEYGKEGTLNESKTALISVDPLELQNYSKVANNFDFSKYDKVTLKSVILETLSQSNDLKSANEKVIQTELSYKEAFAGYLPTVDFQYSIKNTHNLETGDDTIDKPYHLKYNDESYKFTIRQSLYTGEATEFKVRSLKSKLEEAKRKYTIVLEEEIQKAIKAYFGVLFGYKSVVANEKNMEKLNKILEITQIKYDSGALSIGDLSAVKANIANASGKLIRVKSDLADAIDFYLYTVGEDFRNTAPFEEKFPINLTTLDALYEDILENNLNLVNYRLNIQSTKDKLLNMKATFKPKVDLELNYANVFDKEQFSANEETYAAKLTVNYNLYNGGKDTIAAMQVFSSLQELNYRYKEEIKKLKWEISKVFNSIKSLEETLSNTKKEVSASTEMVNSYWEGFQLGEQDLQVLLQGQRQLNGAELDLIKYEQDHLTNIFKLLTSKGELSKYFSIDGGHSDFIDFSNTTGAKTPMKIDLTAASNNQQENNNTNTITTAITQEENLTATQDTNLTTHDTNETLNDLNTTIDEYLEVVKEAGFDNLVNFKDTFLEANDDDYTVTIGDFTNHYDAYTFAKKNRILAQSFSYEYLNKNEGFDKVDTKTKIVNVKTNLAFGIYKSEQEALKTIDTLFDKGEKLYHIVKVKEIKDLYNSYVDGLEAKVEPFIIKPKVIKTFMTNQEFKNRFLSAPKDYYSINVVSLSNISQAESLIKSENIEKDSFVFKYGRDGNWIKVMFGVFSSYESAVNELSKHPEMIKKYRPVIEKIGQKQETYNIYKEFNPLPEWYINEQKEKKEKKDTKVTSQTNDKKEKLSTKKQPEVIASPSDIVIEEPIVTPATPSIDLTPKTNSKEEVPQIKDIQENLIPEEKKEPLVPVPSQKQIAEANDELIYHESPENNTTTNNENNLITPIIEANVTEPLEVVPTVEIMKQEETLTDTITDKNETKQEDVETNHKGSSPTPKIDVVTLFATLPNANQSGTNTMVENMPSNNEQSAQTEKVVIASNPTFEKSFINAPKDYYTIALEAIPDNQRDIFINKYINDDKFTEFSKNGSTQIFYGIFETIEKAREQKFKLDATLIDGIKLYKIGRLDKRIIASLEDKTKTINTDDVRQPQEVLEKTQVATDINQTIPTIINQEQKVEAIEVAPSQIVNDTQQTNETLQEVTPPIKEEQPETTQEIEEVTTPTVENKEVIQVPIIEAINEVQNPTEATTQTPFLNEAIEVASPTFTKEDYQTFEEAFKNAPKDYYTIELGTIPDNQKDAFIKRFILDDQYTTVSKKGKISVYYGVYETIEKAREQKLNLHPKLIGSVKLYKIGKVSK